MYQDGVYFFALTSFDFDMADAAPVPLPPVTQSEQLEGVASSSAPSFFERISSWASRNKATVYTIAGITLVATAAGIYYYSDTQGLSGNEGSAAKRKSKKDRRKGKKDATETAKPETVRKGKSIPAKDKCLRN